MMILFFSKFLFILDLELAIQDYPQTQDLIQVNPTLPAAKAFLIENDFVLQDAIFNSMYRRSKDVIGRIKEFEVRLGSLKTVALSEGEYRQYPEDLLKKFEEHQQRLNQVTTSSIEKNQNSTKTPETVKTLFASLSHIQEELFQFLPLYPEIAQKLSGDKFFARAYHFFMVHYSSELFENRELLDPKGGSRLIRASFKGRSVVVKPFDISKSKKLFLKQLDLAYLSTCCCLIADIVTTFFSSDRLTAYIVTPFYPNQDLSIWMKKQSTQSCSDVIFLLSSLFPHNSMIMIIMKIFDIEQKILDKNNQKNYFLLLNQFFFKKICQAVASGLTFLHQSDIIHGNLSLENILVDEKNVPKIHGFHHSMKTGDFADKESCPMICFPAPEYFDQPSDPKLDIFSFGIILYLCLTGNNSEHRPLHEIVTEIREKNKIQSPQFEELIQQMCSDLAEKRPSAFNLTISSAWSQSVRSFPAIPFYWSKSTQIAQDRVDFVNITDERIPKFGSNQAKQSLPTWRQIFGKIMNTKMELFASTTGYGKDSHCFRFESFEIDQVFRLENHQLWKDYDHTRCKIEEELLSVDRGSLQYKLKPIPDLASCPSKLSDALHLKRAINETLLFHGPSQKKDILNSICKQGIDDRISTKGMFGAGCYFAEDAVKSDQYVNEPGTCYLLCCRVILGDYYTCYSPTKENIDPTRTRRPPALPSSPTVLHNSLLAECSRTNPDKSCALQRFREFVIYDRGQIYPEFLIAYKRKNQIKRVN